MNDVLKLLLANLDEAYAKGGWHGPTLRATLRGVSAELAWQRPAKGRHNVWELTLHAAYWKFVARRRLTGDRSTSFPMKGSNWFASPPSPGERAWKEAVALLDEIHRALRDAVAALTPAELRDPKKLRLVRGIAAHDLYHAGQIQLVKRLVSGEQ